MARKAYARAFKLRAVRVMTDQGLSVAEVARRLGVGETGLPNWRAAAAEEGVAAFPARETPPPPRRSCAVSGSRSTGSRPGGAC